MSYSKILFCENKRRGSHTVCAPFLLEMMTPYPLSACKPHQKLDAKCMVLLVHISSASLRDALCRLLVMVLASPFNIRLQCLLQRLKAGMSPSLHTARQWRS